MTTNQRVLRPEPSRFTLTCPNTAPSGSDRCRRTRTSPTPWTLSCLVAGRNLIPSPCRKSTLSNRAAARNLGYPGVSPALTRRKNAPNALSRRLSVCRWDVNDHTPWSGRTDRTSLSCNICEEALIEVLRIRQASRRSCRPALYNSACAAHINPRASCCLLVGYNLNLNARCTKPTVTACTDRPGDELA